MPPSTVDERLRGDYEVNTNGEPDALKGARPVCAVRRVAISLPEAGGMREDIPGLSVYLETKVEGDKAD